MSRFKSYIKPTHNNDNKSESHISSHSPTAAPRRHITQVKRFVNIVYLFSCI
jgi:hypothetical protein